MRIGKIHVDLLRLPSASTILDVGCGSGYQGFQFARLGHTVFAVDSSHELIGQFRHELNKESHLPCHPCLGDARQLPYRDSAFDAVVCTEVLEHVSQPAHALEEIYRVLRPQAVACISVPTFLSEAVFSRLHRRWNENSRHVNVFKERQLRKLLHRCGFHVFHVAQENFEWSLFWIMHGLLQTPFDQTGTPLSRFKATERYMRGWSILRRLRLEKALLLLGNRVFPKSLYLYVQKK